MSFEFTGAFSVPSIQALLETYENMFWWDRYENQIWQGMVISGAARDSGKATYTDVLRPGLLLGRITSTLKIKEWDPTATDGTEEIFAVLGPAAKMQRLGVDQDRWLGQIMVSGYVKADRLIIPGNSGLGIASDTYEWLVRSQMFRRFLFNDKLAGYGHATTGARKVTAVTAADKTITEAENDTFFTTEGASAAVNFTLPATAKLGLHYWVYASENFNVKVSAGTANTMIAFNDVAADSVALATASNIVGNGFEFFGDGAKWICLEYGHGTVTVA